MSNVYYLANYKHKPKKKSFKQLLDDSLYKVYYTTNCETEAYNKILDMKYDITYTYKREDS